jgi:GT2 family glycosyltransferase
MTLAPAPSDSLATPDPSARAEAGPSATVTAVVVVADKSHHLGATLDALARQTRLPDRVLVVDLGRDAAPFEAVRAHRALRAAVGGMRLVSASSARGAVAAAMAALAEDARTAPDGGAGTATSVEHLWFLTGDGVPELTALARLLDALRRSPSAGVAGPKLLETDRPDRLRSVGLQATRSGRLLFSPRPGEPDQGQHDRRTDVLAVSLAGMLIERALFDRLRGFDARLGDFGAVLDLSWRAHQAGKRVVVVPRAVVRTGSAGPEQGPGARREARRVALTRCALWAAPFLATWVAATSLAAAALLLIGKRPRSAWVELTDLAALLDPWRVLAARWRARGRRRVRRRHLSSLYAAPRTTWRHTLDLWHDHVGRAPAVPDEADRRGALLTGQSARAQGSAIGALETGPSADEAEDLHVLGASWLGRAARHPGVLVVGAATLVAAVAGRRIPGGLLQRFDGGLGGGELVPGRARAATLWHAWLDSWHGPGLGHGGEQSPHLAVLAALTWLGERLPMLAPASSPAGATVAALLGAALPLAALTAYLSTRVLAPGRWLRAAAALAWASTAVLGSAVGGGRLGAVVAAVLLPVVAAGFSLVARGGGSLATTFGTALAAAVLGAFVPVTLVLVAVAALCLALVAPARVWPRALILLAVPPALMGPWLASLVKAPYLLFAGPGLTVWGEPAAAPWQLALLQPAPGAWPGVLLGAPIVLAGFAALLRGGAQARPMTALAALAVVGLALAVAAPRVVLGTVPEGLERAGEPITAWPGTGLLVYALALLAAAVLGVSGLPLRRSAGGWPAVARWPVLAAALSAAVLGAGWMAAQGVGADLEPWSDPRPAVAVDQAEGGLANRMLLVDPGPQVQYRLVGRETGDVARSVPVPAVDRPHDESLAAAVAALFDQGTAPRESQAADVLADHAVGFVGLRAGSGDPATRVLDATAGLSRLGAKDGVLVWRVARATPGAPAPARARLVTEGVADGGVREAQRAVDVSGAHGRLVATVAPGRGTSLVLAEPKDWEAHGQVTFAGRRLAPEPDTSQPTYVLPPAQGRLEVAVADGHRAWRWGQGVLLAVAVFMALPFGGRTGRRLR